MVPPVCTLGLVVYAQSLTWNAILETHTLSDSRKVFLLLIYRVIEGKGETIKAVDAVSYLVKTNKNLHINSH